MKNNNKQDSASNKSKSNSSSSNSRERNNEALNLELLEQSDGLHEILNNFNLPPLSQASGHLPVLMPRLQGEELFNTADWTMRIIDTALAILDEDSLDDESQ